MPSFSRSQIMAAAVVAAVLLVWAGAMLGRSHAGGEIKFIEAGASASTPGSEAPVGSASPAVIVKLLVHVAGKVKSPGVYELPAGSRVVDALDAAGGALPNADLESVNLAEKLADAEQVYIAPKGKVPAPLASVVRGRPASQVSSSSAKGEERSRDAGPEKLTSPGQGTVNINTAGAEELQRLPGVGPATAERIIQYRAEHGRFQSVEELDEVKGIGPAKLAKMKLFVSL